MLITISNAVLCHNNIRSMNNNFYSYFYFFRVPIKIFRFRPRHKEHVVVRARHTQRAHDGNTNGFK